MQIVPFIYHLSPCKNAPYILFRLPARIVFHQLGDNLQPVQIQLICGVTYTGVTIEPVLFK